jgi:hypothetical protein
MWFGLTVPLTFQPRNEHFKPPLSPTPEAVALGNATNINGRPYNIAGNCASGDSIPDDALFTFE